MEHTFFLTSSHEPEPYVRTTSTNGDHDALAETQTAETTASGADENDDDPDDKHEYKNTKKLIKIYDSKIDIDK